jgi:nicotinate-nucleotide--dimethylbenzimidazole phosphoribosyltransferase
MPTDNPPLIASTAKPSLEQALRLKLARRVPVTGGHGELETLAVRLGLMQNRLRPRLRQPQLLIFVGDHGLAVDLGVDASRGPQRSSADQVSDLIASRVPLPVFAHQQGINLQIVDSGLATSLRGRPGVLLRKIAHGTRNCRVTQAMSIDQVNAAIRAGMEITDTLAGNALGCAGLGVGGNEAAALVISRLTKLTLHDILRPRNHDLHSADDGEFERRLANLQAAQARHAACEDPVEVLAAFGGFEIAMMVGAMLAAAHKRHLILVDGIAACAALLVAARIGGPLPEYCVFCRSTAHPGLDAVLAGFQATALLELGLDGMDGTGITLTWPLISAAASLLSDVAEIIDASQLPVLTDDADAARPGRHGDTDGDMSALRDQLSSLLDH